MAKSYEAAPGSALHVAAEAEDRAALARVVSITEACALTGIPYPTLLAAIKQKRVEGRKSGRGTWLTTLGAIERAQETGRLRKRPER